MAAVAKQPTREARADLRELASIAEQGRELDQLKATIARRAIAGGATWTDVGAALGVPKATAYDRYRERRAAAVA